MNQREAFRETLELARQFGMDNCSSDIPEVDYPHLADMWERIRADPNMSEAKLGRWLGWAQAAVVGSGLGPTLDDMKAINKKWAD